MSLSRNYASSLALGALAAAALACTTAKAGDFGDGARISPAASRCAEFGPGFVDMGDGTCSRANSHVHVEFGTRRVGSEAWSGNGASSAELRSQGVEVVPGVGHQLRVRNQLQVLSPYR